MPVVAERHRIAELRRLGVSGALVRLAAGECLHEVFRDGCLGPPYSVYHGAGAPDGPPLVPLWDFVGTVFAVWEQPDGPEFLDFDIECPEDYRVLARTEQGFWATRFDFLYEADTPLEELEAGAAIVGFCFLARLIESCEEADLGTFDGHAAWLRGLVAEIDAEAGWSFP